MNEHLEGFDRFVKLCLAEEDKKLLTALFDLFLTLEEKKAIATRVLIVRELLNGKKTQREIAQQLQVSIAKITRGSNELKRLSEQMLLHFKKRLLR